MGQSTGGKERHVLAGRYPVQAYETAALLLQLKKEGVDLTDKTETHFETLAPAVVSDALAVMNYAEGKITGSSKWFYDLLTYNKSYWKTDMHYTYL